MLNKYKRDRIRPAQIEKNQEVFWSDREEPPRASFGRIKASLCHATTDKCSEQQIRSYDSPPWIFIFLARKDKWI